MALGRVATVAALAACATSITVRQLPPGVEPIRDAAPVNETSTFRLKKATQWSEMRMGPPMLESEACTMAWSSASTDSEWMENDPIIFPEAGIGARRRQKAIDDMEYQLFLPKTWSNNSLEPYPTIIYLHGHASRKWSLMNSESLPRLLARNQSMSFDNRSCWCLDSQYSTAKAAVETSDAVGFDAVNTEDLSIPMADCDFADTFNAIVVMPQGWKGDSDDSEWDDTMIGKVKAITKAVMEKYNGDADNVIVTGIKEGAAGAVMFGKLGLVSSVILADSPETEYDHDPSEPNLAGVPVWVTGDRNSGTDGMDALVASLIARPSGITKYTRFTSAPKNADPEYGGEWNHASDLLYRYPTLWQWAFHHKITDGRTKWGMPLPGYVIMR